MPYCEFSKTSKNAFFTERLWATASVNLKENEEIAKGFSIRKVSWQLYNYYMKKKNSFTALFQDLESPVQPGFEFVSLYYL